MAALIADLNPCDFWLWSHLKSNLYNTDSYPRETYAQLQDSILKIFEEIQREDVQQACLAFWNRAAWVGKSQGAFIVDK